MRCDSSYAWLRNGGVLSVGALGDCDAVQRRKHQTDRREARGRRLWCEEGGQVNLRQDRMQQEDSTHPVGTGGLLDDPSIQEVPARRRKDPKMRGSLEGNLGCHGAAVELHLFRRWIFYSGRWFDLSARSSCGFNMSSNSAL